MILDELNTDQKRQPSDDSTPLMFFSNLKSFQWYCDPWWTHESTNISQYCL